MLVVVIKKREYTRQEEGARLAIKEHREIQWICVVNEAIREWDEWSATKAIKKSFFKSRMMLRHTMELWSVALLWIINLIKSEKLEDSWRLLLSSRAIIKRAVDWLREIHCAPELKVPHNSPACKSLHSRVSRSARCTTPPHERAPERKNNLNEEIKFNAIN